MIIIGDESARCPQPWKLLRDMLPFLTSLVARKHGVDPTKCPSECNPQRHGPTRFDPESPEQFNQGYDPTLSLFI